MDNQMHNTETNWVDSKLAVLVPPADWYPNSKRAYAQFLTRRDSKEPEAGPNGVRLSMVAGILASIGLGVALLPWLELWRATEPAPKEPRLTAGTLPQQTATLQEPKLSQSPLSQTVLSQPQSTPDPNSD